MITKHIYLGNNRIAVKTGAQVLYYHPDHLGSSNVITDASGSQAQLSEYKPFGELSRNTASLNSYYFTGKELDSTGLYYYGARYYDPRLARFITPDPVNQNIYDPQNLNPYAYCRNNPLNLIDPLGASWESLSDSYSDPMGLWKESWGNLWSDWRDGLYGGSSGGFWQGYGSGFYSSVITTSTVILASALIAPLLPTCPIITTAGYILGGMGAAGLGLSTGMAITGTDLSGNPISSYRRGELAAGATFGWGLLGLGAWEQYKNLGSIFNIKDPVRYVGQGGTIVLGRFNDMEGLRRIADQYNGRILDQPVPEGYTLPQYLRGEIDYADKIYLRMKGVYLGTVTNDVELGYIKSQLELRYKTEFINGE